MMKVELVAQNSIKSISGIGRYIRELYSHLAEHIPVQVVYPNSPHLGNRFIFLNSIPLGIKGHKNGSIVHFTQIMGCALMLWNPIHPSVATVHDLGPLELSEEWNMLNPIARQMLRISLAGLKKTDLLVADSEYTRQSIIKHLGIKPSKVVTVYPGIDRYSFYPASDAQSQLTNKFPFIKSLPKPWILYVGSELPRKNITALLTAISILKQEFPTINLIKIGFSGGDRFRQQTINNIKKLGLSDSVTFIEGVTDNELRLFYSSVDAFVQPSKLEGFGFPVFEAMACGAPVVCSNLGLFQKITDCKALLFDPNDANSIYRCMNTVLSDENQRAEMQRLGPNYANQYNWDQTAISLIEIYSQL